MFSANPAHQYFICGERMRGSPRARPDRVSLLSPTSWYTRATKRDGFVYKRLYANLFEGLLL